MNIVKIRHLWPERPGFFLHRPRGTEEYVLLHFLGSVELTMDGRTIITEPGAFVVFEPEKPYDMHSPSPLVHDWMHITGNMTETMRRFGLKPNTVYQPGCSQEISDITEQLEIEFFSGREYQQELTDLKLSELLIYVSRGVDAGAERRSVSKETELRLKTVRAEMLACPEKPWPVEKLAARAGLSASRLYTVYKETFGISPNRDLILLRLEKARFLLLQGYSVGEAAEKAGYTSVSHFIRQFKQEMGKTPREFASGWGVGTKREKAPDER